MSIDDDTLILDDKSLYEIPLYEKKDILLSILFIEQEKRKADLFT